ncbi:MAG: GAF domain-containing protein [Anaerolineae bacterium]|nr:GAF domain-containing protein [Anaerolineae bacterium]
MSDKAKSKAQLIQELEALREQLSQLSQDATDRQRTGLQSLEPSGQPQAVLSEVEMLYQLSSSIGDAENVPDLLQSIAQKVAVLLPAHQVAVITLDLEELAITGMCYGGAVPAAGDQFTYDNLWQGVSGWALRERNSVFLSKDTPDSHEDAQSYARRLAQGVGSRMIVPLHYRERLLGAVVATNTPAQPDFVPHQVDWLTAIAGQLAMAVNNALMVEALQQRVVRTDAAAQVSEAASSILDLDQLLLMAVDLIKEKFDLYYVGIFLVDHDRDWVGLRAGTGEPGRTMLERAHGFTIGSESMIGQCVAFGEPRIPERVEDAVRYVNPLLPDTTAEIALPLISRGQVIGAMSVQSSKIKVFSKIDISILQTMANQIANAIQNAQFYEAAQVSLAEAQALYRVSRAINEAQSVEDIAFAVMDVAVSVGMHYAAIRLFTHWDEDGHPLALEAYEVSEVDDERRLNYTRHIDFDLELYGKLDVERAHEVQIVPDIQDAAIALSDTMRAILEHHNCRSLITAALRVGKRWLGQLALYGQWSLAETPTHYLNVIGSTIVDQVAIALYTRYLLEQIERRAQRMQTASEVSRAASSIIDQNVLLTETVELILERFDLYYAGIFLLDDSGRWAVLRAGTGDAGKRMLSDGHRLEVGGNSMIGTCVATGEPRIALDVGKAATRFNNPHLLQTRSEMALPLASRGEVIGAMTIQSREVAAYSQSDIAILQTMADQLANAIVNARLIAESEARLEEVQRLQQRYAVDMWEEHIETRDVYGFAYDLNQLTSLSKLGAITSNETASDMATPEAVAADVAASGELATWTPNWEELTHMQTGPEGGDGAALLAPLEMKGEPVGVWRFEEPGASRKWSTDDVAVLEAVRDQIALALENRLLLDQSQNSLRETRRREAEVRFLQEVAAFLNETEDVVASAEALTSRLSSFLLLDVLFLAGFDVRNNASRILSVGQLPGAEPIPWLDREFPDGSLASRVSHQGTPYVVDDLQASRHYMEEKELIMLGITSMAVLPLRLGYRALGVLYLCSRTPGAFARPDLLPILLQIAAQVASAIERTNLLRQARASAGESRTLYEATSALVEATSNDMLLRAIIEHTILGEAARAEIRLYVPDPESGENYALVETVTSWSNDPDLPAASLGERVRVTDMPVLPLVGNDVWVCEDVASDPGVEATIQDWYLQQGVRAMIIGRFMIGGVSSGERMGFFQIQFSQPFHPTTQDIRLYNTILGQAAVVISNLQLLRSSTRQTEQLSAAVDLANVTTAISDRAVLLRDSVNFLKDRFSLYFAGIYLLDSEGQWAVLESGSGQEGKNLLQMGHRLQVGATSIVGWCAERSQQRISLDVSKDPLHFLNPLLPDTQSAIALPLISRGQLIGVLSVQSDRRYAFTKEEISTLELMATQLANVIESANLYQRSQSSLAETRMLYRSSQEITDASAVEAVLQAAVTGVSQRQEPDWIAAALLLPSERPTELRIVVTWNREGTEEPVRSLPLDQIRMFYDILQAEERFITPDIAQEPVVDEYVRDFYSKLGLRATAVYPLAVRDVQYGMLMVHNWKTREFSTSELRFYEGVARQASVALQNISLIEATQEEADRRAFLNEVLQTASSELATITLMRNVGKVIAKNLSMPVMMWRWDGHFVSPVAVLDEDGLLMNGDKEAPSFLPNEIPAIYGVISEVESAYIDFRGRKDSLMLSFTAGLRAPLVEAFAVRLSVRDTIFGVLLLGRQEGHGEIDDRVRETVRTAAINVSVAMETASLYQEAQDTAEKLKEVDQLKSQFMANMSHELRTPLNSIIGFSRVILKGIDGPLTDMQKTDLTAIYESGTQLLNLINDILDISKIEAGKMEFSFETTDLKEVVKSVLLVSSALVKDKPIELQADIPNDLPTVMADTRRIRQVLTNLLSNAAKFTDQGFIKVSAMYDNYQVIMSVQDTGIGIPADRLGAVFVRFEQVDSSSTRRYGGTGIGMPLSLEFIKAHGGDMWLESKVGAGSTFFFSLPINGPESKPKEGEVADESRVKNPTSRIVLTVDDDESVITIFRRYLEKQGYIVFGLTDSARVVEEARRLRPYAITLDVIMPGKDGWEVIQDLQADPDTHDIPVIICSIKSEIDKGFSMGVSDYLVKPINEQDLLDALTRLGKPSEEGHILVIDDNADDRKLLHRILSDVGYQVMEASGGAEGVSLIHTSPPSLIILDLMMPDVDGFAVLENLKTNTATCRIPVVVVTAKELTQSEKDMLHQRVEALLQKGIYDQEQLLQDVTVALKSIRKSTAEARLNQRDDKQKSVQG